MTSIATPVPAGTHHETYARTLEEIYGHIQVSKAKHLAPALAPSTAYNEYWANQYRSLQAKVERARRRDAARARHRRTMPSDAILAAA